MYLRFHGNLLNLLFSGFFSAFKRVLEVINCCGLISALINLLVNIPILWIAKVLSYEVD